MYAGEITSAEFFILNDEHHRKLTNVTVQNSSVFEQSKPKDQGLYDSHLGTTDPSWVCSTCTSDSKYCPGHMGDIKLKYPVKNPLFIPDMINWLRIICTYCGSLLQPDKVDKSAGNVFAKHMANRIKSKTKVVCPSCKEPAVYIDRLKSNKLIFVRNEVQVLNTELWDIMNRIPDEVLDLLEVPQKSHPKNFILTNICVPPVNIRPDQPKNNNLNAAFDALTLRLKNIVNLNNNKSIPYLEGYKVDDKLRDQYNLFDISYYNFITSSESASIPKIVSSNSNVLTNLKDRITHKEGRIKHNLCGKRVGYCARCTITGDPTIKLDELSVPFVMAKTLQVKEVVREYNQVKMFTYYLNGVNEYPGCSRIIKKSTGQEYIVNEKTNRSHRLEIGDILYRDLIDGDVVMFNRQPTLTENSTTSMKVKLTKNVKCFSFNVSICVCFNADFDGDEMNAFLPQSIGSRFEIEQLINIYSRTITTDNGMFLIGCFQDALANIFSITNKDVRISKSDAMFILQEFEDNITLDKPSYTGREIISMLLPDINYRGKAHYYDEIFDKHFKYDPSNTQVVIKNGNLESGILDYSSTGENKKNTIFHSIYTKYGSKKSFDVLYNIQRAVGNFMYNEGFTLDGGMIYLKPDTVKQVSNLGDSFIQAATKSIDQLKKGSLIIPMHYTAEEFFEEIQIEQLRIGDEVIDLIFSDISKDKNRMLDLIMKAKKGSMKHLVSMIGIIGSVLISGNRMEKTFDYFRTLPHFSRYNLHPEANGFINSSLVKGLGPIHIFNMARQARIAVINCSLSTSEPGQESREYIKNTENHIVNNMLQVGCGDQVVQFLYNTIGFDVKTLKYVKIQTSVKKLDIKSFHKKYQSITLKNLLDEEEKDLKADMKWYDEVFHRYEKINFNYTFNYDIQLPVDIQFWFMNIKKDYGGSLDPVIALGKVTQFLDNLKYIYSNYIQMEAKATIAPKYEKAIHFIKVYVRSWLNISTFMEYSMSTENVDDLCTYIYHMLKTSLISSGSPIGMTTAQLLIAPMTQYIIDAHHRSGTSANKTKQVDKIQRNRELFVKQDIEKASIPINTIYLKDTSKLNELSHTLPEYKFDDLISGYKIFYEKFTEPTHPSTVHEKKILKEFTSVIKYKNTNSLYPFCIRYSIDKFKLLSKQISLMDIVNKLHAQSSLEYIFLYNSESSNDIFIRCYVYSTSKAKKVVEYIEGVASKLTQVTVRGITNIKMTHIEKNKCIKAYGLNFKEIINHPDVDPYLTRSDVIKEIEMYYGIEAARTLLEVEYEKSDSGFFNAHYQLLSDIVTFTGELTPISEVGLKKRERSKILSRTAYRAPFRVLTEGAVNNVTEQLHGVSDHLLLGQSPRIGTIYNTVQINTEFIQKKTKSMKDIIDMLL